MADTISLQHKAMRGPVNFNEHTCLKPCNNLCAIIGLCYNKSNYCDLSISIGEMQIPRDKIFIVYLGCTVLDKKNERV